MRQECQQCCKRSQRQHALVGKWVWPLGAESLSACSKFVCAVANARRCLQQVRVSQSDQEDVLIYIWPAGSFISVGIDRSVSAVVRINGGGC